jgi:DNA-binding CsgD family transcriptional regulator
MPRAPIVPLLEQIHSLDDDDDVWFARIATEVLHRLKGRCGVNAYRFEGAASNAGGYRSTRISTGTDNDTNLANYDEGLPAQVAHLIYGSGTKAALVASVLRTPRGHLIDFVHDDFQRMRVSNALGMVADDGEGRGLALAVPVAHVANEKSSLAMMHDVATHVGSALQLRRHLGRAPSPRRAWLDTEGELLGVEGLHPTAALRATLRARVRAREAARDICHREGEAAIGMWTHLLDGEWSFLDFEERGGRRRVIAFRNEDATRGLRALTAVERIVVERAAQGRSNKETALGLGMAEPTVANHLARALGKLGIPNRMILIQTFATLMDT